MTHWKLATIQKPSIGQSVAQLMTGSESQREHLETTQVPDLISQMLADGWEPIGVNFVATGEQGQSIEFYSFRRAYDPRSESINKSWAEYIKKRTL